MANPDVVAPGVREGSLSRAQLVLRTLALLLLFSSSAVYELIHVSSLNSAELWIHLRTGTWVLENHAIPRTGLFSQYPNAPWNNSSWGFDLLLGILYRIFGLRALPLLLMALKAAVAVITFLLARSGRAGFWQAVALSAVAQSVISGPQPLPYVFSILFFAVELRLLLGSRHSGSVRELYWLPVLFFVWANLHVQFVLGLILLAAFVTALTFEYWLRMLSVPWLSQRILPLPLKQVSAIAATCLLAACATPYGYRPLATCFKTLYSHVAFEHFAEMAAMTFRRPQDYLLLLLGMMGFMALGRRRSLQVFELVTLLLGTGLAFRVQRDGWVLALAAVGVLSATPLFDRSNDEGQTEMPRAWTWGAVAAGTAVVLALTGIRLPDRTALLNRVTHNFPAAACDALASKQLPQPLFNEYLFGSFVTWYLPQYPVVVDSRVELYGEKTLAEYFDIVGGKERLDEHPMIARAGTLLLQRNSAIDKALRNLPGLRVRYRLVYSDDLADVFIPVNPEQNQ